MVEGLVETAAAGGAIRPSMLVNCALALAGAQEGRRECGWGWGCWWDGGVGGGGGGGV